MDNWQPRVKKPRWLKSRCSEAFFIRKLSTVPLSRVRTHVERGTVTGLLSARRRREPRKGSTKETSPAKNRRSAELTRARERDRGCSETRRFARAAPLLKMPLCKADPSQFLRRPRRPANGRSALPSTGRERGSLDGREKATQTTETVCR